MNSQSQFSDLLIGRSPDFNFFTGAIAGCGAWIGDRWFIFLRGDRCLVDFFLRRSLVMGWGDKLS
jgi:hypothetical protein